MEHANLPDRPGGTGSRPGLRLVRTDHLKDRLARAKAAYSSRRADLAAAARLLTGSATPTAGDLVLARVAQVGWIARLELTSGRHADLHPGDEVVVAYGACTSPDRGVTVMPPDLGPCCLVAAGGVAALCPDRCDGMAPPTRLAPVGLLADSAGRPMNMADLALPPPPAPKRLPRLVAVAGTATGAGKTACAAHLVRGLRRRGYRVGAAKVTGTAGGGDRWRLADAGAETVLDLGDAGVPSTSGLPTARIEQIFAHLTGHLAGAGLDTIVVEIAEGLFQREADALLQSPMFRRRCSGLLLAAADTLGAVAGVRHLEALGHRVLAVGGAISAAPQAVREAGLLLEVPVLTAQDLAEGGWLPSEGDGSGDLVVSLRLRPPGPGFADLPAPSPAILTAGPRGAA